MHKKKEAICLRWEPSETGGQEPVDALRMRTEKEDPGQRTDHADILGN